MDILMVLLNSVNLTMLIAYCIWTLKCKVDSSLFWLLACLLYFVNVPLMFDSLLVFWYGTDDFTLLMKQYNQFWENGFAGSFLDVSVASLIFNVVLILSYHIVIANHRHLMVRPEFDNGDSNLFMSYKVYFALSLIGLLLFIY